MIAFFFFSAILPMFKQTNLLLQREDPCIHLVHNQLNRYLMQLAGKFIPVAEIRSTSQGSDINTNNKKPEQEIFIGISTKTLINKLFEEGDISPAENKSLTLLFIYFILKHSLTQFKNFLFINLF